MAGAQSKLLRDMPDTDAPLGLAMSEAPPAMRYLAAFAMTGFAAVLAVAVDSKVTIPNLSLIFVVPVIIAGVSFGLGPSLFSAILGALAYNFFLTEPRYSLAVNDPADIWGIGLLFVVGVVVSGVAFTSRLRAADAALLRRQTTVLQGYSRDIVAADAANVIASTTCRALATLFQVPAVVMLIEDGKVASVERSGSAPLRDADFDAAQSSLTTGTVVRAGIYPDLTARYDFWPVASAAGINAVIGLAFDADERPAGPEVLVEIVGGVLRLALERTYFQPMHDVRPAG